MCMVKEPFVTSANCNYTLRDFKLPPRYKWGLRSSGLFRRLYWWLAKDVSGKTYRSHLQRPSSPRRMPGTLRSSYIENGVGGDWFTENVTLFHGLVESAGLGRGKERKKVYGTDRMYRNVGVNYRYMLRNVPGERRFQVHFVTSQSCCVRVGPCIVCLYSGLKLCDSQSVVSDAVP